MNYDIKIYSESAPSGKVEFDVLAKLAKSTKDIAIGSLMLRLKGFSDLTPSKALRKSLDIYLDKVHTAVDHGTELTLKCEDFAHSLKGFQYEMFEDMEELMRLTPMALVIQSIQAALDKDEDKDLLDKELLRKILKFKSNFTSKEDRIMLSNRNSIPEIILKKEDFFEIRKLEQSIPEPRKIKVTGTLDEMKLSKMKLGLLTDVGLVRLSAESMPIMDSLKTHLGKELTITGIAHFKLSGAVSFIKVLYHSEPQKGDDSFRKIPSARVSEQQVLFQKKKGKKSNPLEEITGKWPGNESFDELLKMLD